MCLFSLFMVLEGFNPQNHEKRCRKGLSPLRALPLCPTLHADEHTQLTGSQPLQHTHTLERLGARVHVLGAQPVRTEQLRQPLRAVACEDRRGLQAFEVEGEA